MTTATHIGSFTHSRIGRPSPLRFLGCGGDALSAFVHSQQQQIQCLHMSIKDLNLLVLPSFEVPFGSCRGASLAFRLLFILGSSSYHSDLYLRLICRGRQPDLLVLPFFPSFEVSFGSCRGASLSILLIIQAGEYLRRRSMKLQAYGGVFTTVNAKEINRILRSTLLWTN